MNRIKLDLIYMSLVVTLFLSCESAYVKTISERHEQESEGLNNMIDVDSIKHINESKVLCKCFLLDSNSVMLFSDTLDSPIDSIRNDYQEENFYSIKIIERLGNWILVEANSIDKKKSGWIEYRDDLFATYAANYRDTLYMYDKPEESEVIVHQFNSYIVEPLIYIDCEGGFIEVNVNKNGRIYNGWVDLNKTCPNPYTTCN